MTIKEFKALKLRKGNFVEIKKNGVFHSCGVFLGINETFKKYYIVVDKSENNPERTFSLDDYNIEKVTAVHICDKLNRLCRNIANVIGY